MLLSPTLHGRDTKSFTMAATAIVAVLHKTPKLHKTSEVVKSFVCSWTSSTCSVLVFDWQSPHGIYMLAKNLLGEIQM